MHNIDTSTSTSSNTAGALPILLKSLRLPTILDIWQQTLQQAEREGWNYTKFLSVLFEHELETKNRKKIKTLLKKSELPPGKSLATFDFSQVQNLNRAKIDDLASNTNWVRQAENILIFGPSGVGKSHLSAAIGFALIEQNIKVLFTSTTKLVQNLQASRKDCTLPAALAKLNKYEVIILDDIGYVRKDEAETHVLFELIAERYEQRSLIITSNQPFSEWDSIFATNSMTIAAIDRLIHHSTIFEITSESYRKKHALTKQI